MAKIKTREQYLKGEISFSDYYAQFLDDETEGEMLEQVSLEEIRESKDEHLNDIPMRKWDAITGIRFSGSQLVQRPTIRRELAERIKSAGENISAATLTCIYKR